MKHLTIIVALLGAVSCRAQTSEPSPRLEETPAVESAVAPVGVDEGSAVPTAPTVRGAVLTVLTLVGPTAPAVTQDLLSFVRVTLSSGAASLEQIDIPVGGSVVLGAPELEGTATVSATLFDPAGVEVGSNRLEVERLAGSVGVISLEVGASPTVKACRRCSTPEPMTETRNLMGTLLFWSAGSSSVSFEGDDRLHVGVRAAVSEGERNAAIEAAGGSVVEVAPRSSAGLVWMVVQAEPSSDVLQVALALSRRPEVKGIELYRQGYSGALLVPLESGNQN